MKKVKNREMAMSAPTKQWNGKVDMTAGMYVSEKLDGMRALWIPCTVGLPIAKVPFANRARDSREHVCTGLWSKYGKVIHCPPSFIKGFPDHPLDGELFLGRKQFQPLMSIVKELIPDTIDWFKVKYKVIDKPTYSQLFTDGKVNNPNYTYVFNKEALLAYFGLKDDPGLIFDYSYRIMARDLKETEHLELHQQLRLSFSTTIAVKEVEALLASTIANDGEGLIIRNPSSYWAPYRERYMIKVKNEIDDEATVIGFKGGTGKYRGMMGCMVVKWQDKHFELGTGFSDVDRALRWPEEAENLEEMLLEGDASAVFKLGEQITFKYRELSDSGIPKEGRFFRKRPGE